MTSNTMTLKSTHLAYGRRAQLFHWVSAILILVMIPLGFLMQNVESEATKLLLYRGHAFIGVLVLLLTLLRILWRWIDNEPLAPQGIEGLHLRAFKITHVLLYLVLLVIAASGVGTILLGGMGDILSGVSTEGLPTELGDLPPRIAHGVTARIYIALLAGHMGGVLLHQFTKSDVMGRMGWKGWKSRGFVN